MYTIERCPHDSENPYTMVSTALIRDENLHPITRWILISLLSNKAGWKINGTQFVNLLKKHGIGRNKVYSFFQQACEVGYMQKVEYREGNLNRTKYLLSERPKFKKSFPHPESQDPENELKKSFPHPDCRDSDSRDYKYKHQSSKEDLRKEDYADAKKEQKFVKKRVSMELVHYQKLISEYGQQKIDEMLERLDEYADINPKRFRQYANHATVIRKWLRNEGMPKPNQRSVLEEVKEKCIRQIRSGEIEISNNSISFKKGHHHIEFYFADKDFESKLKNQLSKMGIKIE